MKKSVKWSIFVTINQICHNFHICSQLITTFCNIKTLWKLFPICQNYKNKVFQLFSCLSQFTIACYPAIYKRRKYYKLMIIIKCNIFGFNDVQIFVPCVWYIVQVWYDNDINDILISWNLLPGFTTFCQVLFVNRFTTITSGQWVYFVKILEAIRWTCILVLAPDTTIVLGKHTILNYHGIVEIISFDMRLNKYICPVYCINRLTRTLLQECENKHITVIWHVWKNFQKPYICWLQTYNYMDGTGNKHMAINYFLKLF